MNEQSLVSVVIANYNMGQFLALAIHSVLDQTYPAVEVHVVDDGSTDNTREVMKAFIDDPRVQYHYQENAGQPKAKNLGIRHAKGSFIAFLDADDVWARDKLEQQMPLFDHSGRIGVVYSKLQYITEQGQPLPTPDTTYYTGKITAPLLIENFVRGMTAVVRRECFEAVGLFDESLPMGIDYDLWLRISTKFDFEFLDKVTYFYRVWPGQMSRDYERRFRCAVEIMDRFLKQNPGVVDRRTIAHAWAHTYASQAYGCRALGGRRAEALKYYVLALRACPTYYPAWRGLLSLAIPKP